MTKEKKSRDLPVEITRKTNKAQVMGVVERAAAATKLYISHIGGFSRLKYPGAVHWHFKRDRKEPGLIDATYWEQGSKFWLIVRNREPQWVHDTAPVLQKAIREELERLPS